MIAYKFLCSGGVGLFSGLRWPLPSGGVPGDWVSTKGPLREAVNGIHSCRVEDLAGWLDDELWTVELSGRVLECETTVVGRRGRLLGRVTSWSGEAAGEFTAACVLRARDRAVEALRSGGLEVEAHALASAGDVDAVGAVAAEQATRLDGTACAPTIAFVADTAVLARGQRPDAWRAVGAPTAGAPRPAAIAANLGFVVAHGRGLASAAAGGAYEAGVASERSWQADWLAERLELEPTLVAG